MTIIRFVAISSVVGFVVPIVFTALWALLERYPGAYASVGGKLEVVQLLLWPSSVFMMATAGQDGINYKMLVLSIGGNVALYALIGFLLWLGLSKQRWVLYVTAGVVAIGWYKLLNL